MQQQVLVVRGYKELLQASKDAERATRLEVRHAFRDVGELVRVKAAHRLSSYSSKSASGLKVRVRQRGIAVEQSLPKTDGPRARKNYGSLQMRKALLPALDSSEEQIQVAFEDALDKVALIFNE